MVGIQCIDTECGIIEWAALCESFHFTDLLWNDGSIKISSYIPKMFLHLSFNILHCLGIIVAAFSSISVLYKTNYIILYIINTFLVK